jgi:transcriptional regulator with XRE-family HTH domain
MDFNQVLLTNKWTQTKVANLIGVSQGFISRVRNKQKNLSVRLAAMVAEKAKLTARPHTDGTWTFEEEKQ